MDAIEKAGHTGKIVLGMDVAASEFWVPEKNVYDLDFKTEGADKDASAILSGDEL
jgi:enolase